jgi:hypothetical protein
MTISSLQLKLSLSADGMSYQAAAEKFGTNKSQISEFISTGVGLSDKIIDSMERHFKTIGHAYIKDSGLQVRKEYTYFLKGREGLRAFYDDVYEAARYARNNQQFCIFNGSSKLVLNMVGKDWYEMHRARMVEVKDNIDFKIIVEKGTTNLIASDFAKYRYWSSDKFVPEIVYIYGDRFAFISFTEDSVDIRVNVNPKQAKAMLYLFQPAWEQAHL